MNGKVLQHTSFHFLMSFIKDLGFRRIIVEMRQRPEHEITSRCCDSIMCGCGSDSQGPLEGQSSHGQRSCVNGCT